ncbi:hypothetical protein BHYA_0817g00010 [Botrytis hyacinthi]|uniref:Uncharacterized protein n=1 Tax=Botrytis hyacinthi TaxID=278943 RepID=A0A4Z1G392_9HELO|nr:hypothetical protein BHYA_0817g00010 [Botrytis hyacinthi]
MSIFDVKSTQYSETHWVAQSSKLLPTHEVEQLDTDGATLNITALFPSQEILPSPTQPICQRPRDLTPPRHPAAFENSRLDNKKANTFPADHDRNDVNPARNKVPRVPMPDSTSNSSNRTAESGVHDHKQGNGDSNKSGPMTSMLERWGAHQSTRSHDGKEMNGEDGKGKKMAKKIKKSGGLVKLLAKGGNRG